MLYIAERYGTHHSDCIVTERYANASKSQSSVDSTAVYVNASTRFLTAENSAQEQRLA
jgi:gamma-glutamyl phosphate reductase